MKALRIIISIGILLIVLLPVIATPINLQQEKGTITTQYQHIIMNVSSRDDQLDQRYHFYLRQLPAKVVSAAVGGGIGGGIGGAIGGGIGYVVGGPIGGGVGGAVGGGIGGAIGGGIGGGRGGAIGGGIGGAIGGGIGGFIAGPIGGGLGGLLGGGLGAGLGAYYINDTLTILKNDTMIILITHQEDLAGMIEADYEYDFVELDNEKGQGRFVPKCA